jgi:prepilin-type N-terminal cleavage/methylation domain-containing protein
MTKAGKPYFRYSGKVPLFIGIMGKRSMYFVECLLEKRSPWCAMKRERVHEGFTLAEVIIVILITGIVALAGLPALTSSLQHSRLSGAASEAVNALQYAQLTAMTSGRKTRVVIGHLSDRIGVRQYTTTGNLFSGDQLAAGDVESGTYELMDYPPKKGTKYPILFDNEDRFRGVDITISDFDQSDPVDFDTLGSPSHGGTATLALGDLQMVVTLDALTGKVSVSE